MAKQDPNAKRNNPNVAGPGVRRVNWNRDVKQNVSRATRDQLDALSIEHTQVRQQLDILRKTRSQRDVGTLKIPAHLQTVITIDDTGVKQTGGIALISEE